MKPLTYRLPMAFVSIVYEYTTVAMAIDRCLATTKPLSYKSPKMTIFVWITGISSAYLTVVALGLFDFIPPLALKLFLGIMISVNFAIVAVCYVIVVLELRQQQRKVGRQVGVSFAAGPCCQAMSSGTVSDQLSSTTTSHKDAPG